MTQNAADTEEPENSFDAGADLSPSEMGLSPSDMELAATPYYFMETCELRTSGNLWTGYIGSDSHMHRPPLLVNLEYEGKAIDPETLPQVTDKRAR